MRERSHPAVTALAGRVRGFPVRMARRMARHKIRWILVALTLMLTGVDWMMRPAQDSYALSIGIMHCLAIVITGMSPRMGNLAIMLIEATCCLILPVGGPSRLWGGCLALGLFSYTEGTLSVVALGTVAYSLLQIMQMASPSASKHSLPTPAGSIFLISTMLVTALFGYSFRRMAEHRRVSEQSHRHAIHEQQEQRLYAAARMHDSVANQLANIIMQTETDAHPTDATWRKIHSEAQQALDELHDIIDMMQQQDMKPRNTNIDIIQQLQELCASQDQRLRSRGMRGQGLVKSWATNVIPGQRTIRLPADLIKEIYANIGKYADDGAPYQMSITLYDEYLEIIQSNRIATHHAPSVGGKGLSTYARLVSHNSGVLSYGPQGDEWCLYALIPLTNTTEEE